MVENYKFKHKLIRNLSNCNPCIKLNDLCRNLCVYFRIQTLRSESHERFSYVRQRVSLLDIYKKQLLTEHVKFNLQLHRFPNLVVLYDHT